MIAPHPPIQMIRGYIVGQNIFLTLPFIKEKTILQNTSKCAMPSTHVHTSACYQVATIGKVKTKGFQERWHYRVLSNLRALNGKIKTNNTTQVFRAQQLHDTIQRIWMSYIDPSKLDRDKLVKMTFFCTPQNWILHSYYGNWIHAKSQLCNIIWLIYKCDSFATN